MKLEFGFGTFLMLYASVQEAFDVAIGKFGVNASVLAMPYGGSMLRAWLN